MRSVERRITKNDEASYERVNKYINHGGRL